MGTERSITMSKTTSITDIDGDKVTFEPQSWAGFNIQTSHCHRAFQNDKGPTVALAVLDACGYGNSAAAGMLYSLVRDLAEDQPADLEAVVGPELDQEDIVPAELADDPATWGSTDAAAKALAILEAAGIESADTNIDKQLFGGPEKGAEYAVMWLRQLAEHQAAKAKETADRAQLEAEAYAYYRASCLATDTVPAPDWATATALASYVERDFIAIARTAREIHGVQA